MDSSCKILNIESDSQQVRIDFRYTNCHGNGGWARISSDCFIRPAGTESSFILLEAENIPLAPEKVSFQKVGDVLFYTLIFPPLPKNVTEIDIIEDEDDNNAFNFYEVPLIIKHTNMTTNTTTALKNIEQLALELKGDRKNQKSFIEEIKRLDSPLNELSAFLKLSKEETAIFSLGLYISVTSDLFCISEIKSFCNFSPFDFFDIKIILKSLLKKGWVNKCASRGIHRGTKRIEEKVFNVAPSVMNYLYKNETPIIDKKEPDVYLVTDMLHNCMREFTNYELEFEEMNETINELEEEFFELNPFKVSKDLDLNENERLVLYYLVTKTSIGEDIIEIDTLLSHFFKSHHDRILMQKLLTKQESNLFKQNYIEFVKEDFRTDKQLKLTEDGIKRIFGEDACFLTKEDGFSSGLCKLIKCDAIIEKELFYNENEQQSINTVSEFLKKEKFGEIVKRLEENKMRPGLTILLHGYPGTGKTETIYQLARQTKRNILLVNISEIRDKWVGESEKRLKAVFETYKNSFKHFEQVPILLFNESDALIGKRININSSVDQMNNAMQNILLQELEDFKGILMATTNLTSNLDDAFERRFLFKIRYSKPSMNAKISIWKSKLSFLSGEDAKRLAEEFDFSGGQIENISRKLFLDTVLLGKLYTIEDTIQYCTEEILLDRNKTKIGF